MSAHKPTAEQQAIIEAAKTGASGVVEAGAGTGKTSTLAYIAEALSDKRGLYLAYNKAIQVEAASKFPSNVECRTAHSLAYRQFGAPMRHRLNGQRMSAKARAAFLGIAPFTYQMQNQVTNEIEDVTLHPAQIAVVVNQTLNRFYNSADREPNKYHIPNDRNMNGDGSRDNFVAHVLPYVHKAWVDIQDKRGTLPFVHDAYLKMWSLSNPKLSYDFILFDEAQDANPAISVVVESQAAQTIMVGDRAQAIYGWRGAIDAMQNFKSEWRLFLTQSFRFGQPIANEANNILRFTGTPLRLTGFEQIESEVIAIEMPDCILCRTNAGCIEAAMNFQRGGKKVAIVGGTKEIQAFAYAANDLMQGKPTSHPELAIFNDWSDVQAAVKSGEAEDLGMLVRLIDNYSVTAVLDVCRNSTKPDEADIIISTAHKAKGLEWDAVQIHTDFKAPKEGNTISKTEAMLLYVAITRAARRLDIGALTWLADMEPDSEEGEAL